MGAWGYKTFQNDAALDWLGALANRDSARVKEALDAVNDAAAETYLGDREAAAALAAAELVAAALGKGEERLHKDAAAWLGRNREATRDLGAARAHAAVARVYASSELREEWDDNGPDTEWHADVRELMKRLAP